MVITNNSEEIKYFCDVFDIIANIDDVLFYGEIVQDLICQLYSLLPSCTDFLSGIETLRGGTDHKIFLPGITCVGDHSSIYISKIISQLHANIICSLRTDSLICFEIWNGKYSVDVSFRDCFEIRHEADNLAWSKTSGFDFFYEPKIIRKTIFEPVEVELFRYVDRIIEKCTQKRTIIHEFDIDTCRDLVRRKWTMENIFVPVKPKLNDDQDLCMACLSTFEKNQDIVTNCGKHNFHQNCLIHWWNFSDKNYGCSVCKNEIITQTFQMCDNYNDADDELP